MTVSFELFPDDVGKCSNNVKAPSLLDYVRLDIIIPRPSLRYCMRMVRNTAFFPAIIHTCTARSHGHSYLTTCGLSTRLDIFVAEIAAASALTYSPRPIRRLPLKPITIDDIVVRTVPMTDAITFTPHNSVIS